MASKVARPSILTSRYEKPIPDDGYYLTQSCVIGAFYPASEPLVARLYDLLGRRWAVHGDGAGSQNTCCSGIALHGDVFTIESTLLTVARLWSIAAETGFENVTPVCVTSFAVHSECLELLESEPGLAEKVDRLLFEACGRRLVIPTIVHTSDVVYRFRSQLAALMRYRLVNRESGLPLRVVDHVGCHYNKLFQHRSIGGNEYCDVLAAMIREWGGVEVDYPERRHCCGMGFRQCMIRPNRGFTLACVRKKLESMGPFEPDLILTNCPGCIQILDGEQWAVNELTGSDYRIPVLSHAELAGLLLGWDPYDVVGIDTHVVPVEPLLERIGIPVGVKA
jgi:heterodisulfide reductase subunit B